MSKHIIALLIYGIFLILGGFMGLRKGSKVSLYAGGVSGALVFVGIWILSFNPHLGWIFLTALNILLSIAFSIRLIKTRKIMPSGMLLIISLAALIFCACKFLK